MILNESSQDLLRKKLKEYRKEFHIDENWIDYQIPDSHNSHKHQQLNHHMTIFAGSAEKGGIQNLGEKIKLIIIGFGYNETLGVAAWKVESQLPVQSGAPHITALLKNAGIKPFLAKEIKDWKNIEPFEVEGAVCEALDEGQTNPPGYETKQQL